MSDATSDTSHPGDALADTLKRTELQHRPSSIPGREIVQVLTEIPAGVESGWLMPPGEEVGYIVAGTVEVSGTGVMLSTYIVPVDQPLAMFAEGPTTASVSSEQR